MDGHLSVVSLNAKGVVTARVLLYFIFEIVKLQMLNDILMTNRGSIS